jgi:hypothetical protein
MIRACQPRFGDVIRKLRVCAEPCATSLCSHEGNWHAVANRGALLGNIGIIRMLAAN